MATKSTTIRRDNLRALIEQHDGPNALSRRLGYRNASFVVTMAGPHPTRDVTEKTARAIEEKLGLPAGWLDQPSAPRVAQHNGDGSAAPAANTPADMSAEPGQGYVATNTKLVNEVVRNVAETCEKQAVSLPSSRLADVVTLALSDAIEHGGNVRQEFVQRIVTLFKQT